jgi:hexosaminidase
MLDEIIEVIQPKEYVHMGHDEVYGIGICPICKQKDPADLFAQDVNRIHAYLAAKGLKMMIWADMLQPVTKYRTPAAIDKIPRDILLLDFIWYFHMDKDIEDNLLAKGFQVMMGNMYSSHYPRYESRITKPGMVGAQISAWTTTNEDELGREGKIYDFLYTGEMLWNPQYDGRHRLSYDRYLKTLMPKLRQDLKQIHYPTPNHTTVLLENTATYPLSAPTNTACEADILCDSLVFEHATVEKITRIPWISLRTIGCYEVEYADSTVLEIPLSYGGNISHWNRRQNEPFRGGYYRHNGYSGTYFVDAEESKGANGENISVYRYEWLNPKPATPIRSIRLRQYPDHPTVFPHRITAVKE